MSDFIPQDFTPPKSPSRYTKIAKDSSVKLRIVSSPTFAWEYFTADNKPCRVPFDRENPNDKPTAPVIPGRDKNETKFIWILTVWNYNTEQVELYSIAQRKIQNDLLSLSRDPDFGNPKEYDIKIERKGDKLLTTYTVLPLARAPLPKNILDIIEANPVNHAALFENGDPFEIKPY